MSNEIPWKKEDILLNRFRIDDILLGGMGVVYKTFDIKTSKYIAVKTYRTELLWKNSEISELFLNEAKTWIQLGLNGNIVQAKFVENVRGMPCIFMEYVEGTDLDWWIKNRNLDLKLILAFAIQFCMGMVYSINTIPNIVHCDIKPKNVLIGSNNVLKITDWGISKLTSSVLGYPFGTHQYMAPERYESMSCIDSRSDIYSFGVMFYQMISNRLPLIPKDLILDQNSWKKAHQKNNPIPLSHYNIKIPTKIEQIIMACLEKLPENRPFSFQYILNDLQDIYENLYDERINVYEIIIKRGDYERECDNAASWIALLNYENAISSCDKAIELKPNDKAAWINKGIALDKLNRNEEALECYEQALSIDSEEPMIWNNLGNTLGDLGRYNEALKSFNKALALNQEYEIAWNNKGWILFDSLSKYEEALNCYDEALKIDPNYADAWNNRGLVLCKIGRKDASLLCFKTALLITPSHLNALINIGGLLIAQKKIEESIKYLECALIVNPNSYHALNNIGAALIESGDYNKAIEYIDKAISLSTNLNSFDSQIEKEHNINEALANKGNASLELGKLQDAEYYLQQAIELNPNNSNYYALLGLVYYELQDYIKSREHFETAIGLGTERHDVYFNLSLILDIFNEYESALNYLHKAVKIKPDFYQAHNSFGAIFYKTGQYGKAIKSYLKCIQINPTYFRAFNNLGLLFTKIEYFKKAEEYFKKAIEIKENYSDCWRNLGMLYLKLRKEQDALICFQNAVHYNPNDYISLNNISVLTSKDQSIG